MRGVLMVVGATIGVGVFALPYFFARSGVITGALVLAALCVALSFAHTLYYRALIKNDPDSRLPAMAAHYLGPFAAWIAYIAVGLGFIFSLIVLIVFGASFLRLLIPSFGETASLAVFWAAIALPFFFKERALVKGEVGGTIIKIAAIVGVFFLAPRVVNFSEIKIFDAEQVFTPFGPILFALAAWPAVSQVAALHKKRTQGAVLASRALTVGTFLSGALYLLFILAVILGAPEVAKDTVSGISAWPDALKLLLGAVGILGAWTVSLSVGLELSETLIHDAKMSRFFANAATLCIPAFFIFFGFSDISPIISFSGGVLVAAQYFLILSVSRKVLALKGFSRFASLALELVFLLAAGMEIYYFMRR